MALTDEQKANRLAVLASARATAKANREKAAAAQAVPRPEPEVNEADEEIVQPAPAVAEPEEAEGLELSPRELERIREEAKKKVDAEFDERRRAERKELIAKTLDAETQRQRREAGLTDYRDDLEDILIDVAPFAADIRIDDTIYQHSSWYTVTRRQGDTLREIMARGWDAEDRAGNPNRRFRRDAAGTMNPMLRERRLGDGTLTIGLETRVNGKTGAVIGGMPTVGA